MVSAYESYDTMVCVGIRAQNHILGFKLCPKTLNGPMKDK